MVARKVSDKSSDRLTVTLDAEDRAKLNRLAERSDRSLAWHVREAIKRYLIATQGKVG